MECAPRSVAFSLALSIQSAAAQSDMPAMDSSTHHGAMTAAQAGATPTLPGQDAFGAIQEILRILEADPGTDWSRVNIDALREHLIDMNEVTLHADAASTRRRRRPAHRRHGRGPNTRGHPADGPGAGA